MEASEAAAIERVRAGDTDAFRVLVEMHSRTLFRVAFRVVGNEHDAEDVVQEAFLRAYRQIRTFDGRSAFGTWLGRIAVNCGLDLLRSRGRRREAVDPTVLEGTREMAAKDPTPDRVAASSQMRERLAAALAELSPAERTAFLMRHCEGVPIEEIARVLGRPNGATRHSVFRAVQKLRRALAPLAESGYEASL